jgi:diguanylate cyclase (GGDEF)-like protein/PAS domain S-box-containing protein
MLFVAFFGHHLTRSVRQLRDSARRIADGNIDERLSLTTNIEEIYDLAIALENMRVNLVSREREIALHAARQTAVLDTADEGIIALDEESLIQNLNPAAEKIFGYHKNELIGTPFSKLLIPGDILRFFTPDGTPHSLSHQELTGIRKSGEQFYLLLSVREGIVGTTSFFTVMVQDNSERHIYESEMEYLATHDTLTDLPNRTLLYDRLQQAITQCTRSRKFAAILFIDLDRFKNVNDLFGHAVGDTVLREVADRLSSCLREVDSVARNGGDEFTVVLPMLNTPSDASLIAQKIITSLIQPFTLISGEHSPDIYNKELCIGGSIGISIFPKDGNDVDSLLNKADAAMYQSKASGGNCYLFYSD